VAVATVDHGLRPESAHEAALVARAAAGFGLPHRTLHWRGEKPAHGVPEAAREARYALLVAHAREIGASHLITAHTQDDQAETVLMRLARGSGPAGLAGMRPLVDRDGIHHARPLLGVPKADLVALCREHGWPFVEDPTNRDERFARPRWRRLAPLLAAEGLTPKRLARLAARVRRAEEALEAKARQALVEATGEGGLSLRRLAEEPAEIVLRALALALGEYTDSGEPLRLERLEAGTEALLAALHAGKPLRRTLGGVVLSLDRLGDLAIAPEPPRRRGRSTSP
jgi:tRNA(Ile)-lysidine synthase